jgi:hypothetical protein
MKTKGCWREHLRDLIGSNLDPTIYAVQWADDARCMQRGAGHRRVGESAVLRSPLRNLWSAQRKWM